MALLDDLIQAERESTRTLPCPLCELIRAIEDDVTRETLAAAAAGTIGERKLVSIMQKNETGVGIRTIRRHRREEHTP